MSIEHIQSKLLDGETALLEYVLSDSGSFVFCITDNKTHVYELPSRKQIQETAFTLRDELTLPRFFSPVFLKTSRELFTWLIEPCMEDLRDIEDLVIIPDGILGYLPFEVLISKDVNIEDLTEFDEYAELPYLVKDYNINTSPSATVLAQINEHPKEPLPDMLDFVAIGNPQYEPAEEEVPLFAQAELQETDVFRSAFPEPTRSGYVPLPSTGIEVERICSLFPQNQCKLFMNGEANEQNVKSSDDLPHAKYVHFACHGVLNENNPEFSGLVLSLYPKDSPGQLPSGENGYLQMYEIYNLDLHADLVTLSACETGLGKMVKGEGIMGLSRAFMYAGTPSVIVSLWQIADESTAEFMYQFYNNLVNENMDKEGALREAKLEMIKSERYSHPFYWASFVLIGEKETTETRRHRE
ncbi:CHAT domain-containing protein [bacterium]|nr:CHAT domain-containing protein [bacterium]